jgi:hypothetical protein
MKAIEHHTSDNAGWFAAATNGEERADETTNGAHVG